MKFKYYNFRSNYSPFKNPFTQANLLSMGFAKGSFLRNNLVVTVNLRNARIASLLFPLSKVIVWTHEPRYDTTSDRQARGYWGKKIDVLNVYTGDVYWKNTHFFGRYHYDDSIDLGITSERLDKIEGPLVENNFTRRKLAVAVLRKKERSKFDCMVKSANVDANEIRQEIACIGHEMGVCDIVGSGWGGAAIEESGYDGANNTVWWERKIEIMSSYRFSLSMENTIWPYYVTEKIWQSIRAYSLPVYWGKTSTIYETFPKQSFVDASEFPTPHDLFEVLKSMGYAEWRIRMNKCIDAYNKQVEIKRKSTENEGLRETIARLEDRLT